MRLNFFPLTKWTFIQNNRMDCHGMSNITTCMKNIFNTILETIIKKFQYDQKYNHKLIISFQNHPNENGASWTNHK